MRLNRFQKRKAAHLKWSKNANAAKARKRMEREPIREPKLIATTPWRITLTNTLDGARISTRINSARHAKRLIDALVNHYESHARLGGQERL